MAETCTDEAAATPDGKERLRLKERRWLPPELITLLESAGFAVAHRWGGTSGAWNRRPLRLDESEVMVASHHR